MKKLLSYLMIFLLVFGLTACGSDNPGDADKKVDLTALIGKIKEDIELPMMEPVTDETLTSIYGINPEDVEDYAGTFSMINISAADLIVVKAKPDTVEAVRAGLEARIEQQKKTFESYLLDQYEAAAAAEVKQYGNYLALVILAQNADTASGMIANAFK